MKFSALSFTTALMLSSSAAAAAPFPMTSTIAVGHLYTFTANSQGGSGDTYFNVPTVPAGYYLLSWNATFSQEGSTSAPTMGIILPPYLEQSAYASRPVTLSSFSADRVSVDLGAGGSFRFKYRS